MEGMDMYRKLRDKLSVAPSGVPPGDRFLEILKTLFTAGEAELALIIPFMPVLLSDVAKASRFGEKKAEELLTHMAEKGIVYSFDRRGETMVMLFSFETLYNYPIKYRLPDVDQARLRSLWGEYFKEGWDRKPGAHVIAGRVLPVGEDLKAGSVVVPHDLIYKYIDEARHLCVGDCSCRSIVRGCNSPIETCIGLGYAAKFLVEKKLSRPIDKEEARSIVRRAHDAGLVSISNNAKDNIGIICHCCRCCCGQLGVATRFNRYDLRPVGSFVAEVDGKSCTACGSCIDVCPMDAISIDGTAFPDPGKCIGCGLCVSSCPEGSLSLAPRKPPPEVPNDVIEYAIKSVRAQGTEEEFKRELKINKD